MAVGVNELRTRLDHTMEYLHFVYLLLLSPGVSFTVYFSFFVSISRFSPTPRMSKKGRKQNTLAFGFTAHTPHVPCQYSDPNFRAGVRFGGVRCTNVHDDDGGGCVYESTGSENNNNNNARVFGCSAFLEIFIQLIRKTT